MSLFSQVMHCHGRTDRLTYQRNIALLAAGKAAIDLVVMSLSADIDPGTIALSWLNPFVLVGPWLAGALPMAVCLGTFLFFSGLVWNSVHRLRHAGLDHRLGLVAALPFAGLVAAVVCAFLPGKKRSVWDITG